MPDKEYDERTPFLTLLRLWEAGLASNGGSKREWIRAALTSLGAPPAFLYEKCTCDRPPEEHLYIRAFSNCEAQWVSAVEWEDQMFERWRHLGEIKHNRTSPSVFKYPKENEFDPVYEAGARAVYKSQIRIDHTKVLISELRHKLNKHGLTNLEWIKAMSLSLNERIQRLG